MIKQQRAAADANMMTSALFKNIQVQESKPFQGNQKVSYLLEAMDLHTAKERSRNLVGVEVLSNFVQHFSRGKRTFTVPKKARLDLQKIPNKSQHPRGMTPWDTHLAASSPALHR